MLTLEMLDVAVGMIFVFLLISLICTAINEMVEAKLKLRAVDLEQGIRILLNNDAILTKQIYDHPLIDGLFKGSYQMVNTNGGTKQKRYAAGSNLPSYIPSKNFALALINICLPATSNGTSQFTDIKNLLLTIDKISNTNVRRALSSIVNTAGNDINRIREGIEDWYNSSMDRVSGWYKRRVQKIVFFLGLAIVVFMNADSIVIFNNLVNDRPLRSSIVDAARRLPATGTVADSTSTSKIKANVDTLYKLSLPIGWNWKSNLNSNKNAITNYNAIPLFANDAMLYSLLQWFLKIIGWFITAFAISLGAPFWFDVLNKVMVVRSTVKPTEKSPEEFSQDRQK
jgi:hypothetical protein